MRARQVGESVVVLFQGGRLASWYALSPEERRVYEQAHVDLMLEVAERHRLRTLEGFKLMTPQQRWQRFWLIEFPTLAGAEAWIEAEMAPPYGSYGYYTYHLSRRWQEAELATWVTNPAPPVVPYPGDPHRVPTLEADTSRVVVLLFGRWAPGADEVDPALRGDAEHVALMHAVAREHGLMRIEAFKLLHPQVEWHRAWVMEFPTLVGAEAWIDAEVRPPHGNYAVKSFYLARRWAPAYFAAWVPR